MTLIHPSSIVDKGAELGSGVRIGPFCHVTADVVLGDDVELIGHVTVLDGTRLGAGCQVYPNAVLGGAPQNFKHKGGRTTLEVGSGCVIRESVTMHRGTDTSRGKTTIGRDCLFMVQSHVAHDCAIGDNVTMANNSVLGGHVEVASNVIISGAAAVHQFVRIGHHAFLGGCAAVAGDVIPFGMAQGDRARLRGLNVVGMKRSGMSREQIFQIRKAYKMLFDPERPLAENVAQVREAFPDSPEVLDVVNFLAVREKRQFTVPRRGPSGTDKDDGGED
jgi:UDP-N-acetylglucosamine acyltransferase